MIIKFEQTLDDTLAFVIYCQYNATKFKTRGWFLIVAVVVLIAINLYGHKPSSVGEFMPFVLTLLIGIGIFTLFRSKRFYKMMIRNSYKKQSAVQFNDERILTFN